MQRVRAGYPSGSSSRMPRLQLPSGSISTKLPSDFGLLLLILSWRTQLSLSLRPIPIPSLLPWIQLGLTERKRPR